MGVGVISPVSTNIDEGDIPQAMRVKMIRMKRIFRRRLTIRRIIHRSARFDKPRFDYILKVVYNAASFADQNNIACFVIHNSCAKLYSRMPQFVVIVSIVGGLTHLPLSRPYYV